MENPAYLPETEFNENPSPPPNDDRINNNTSPVDVHPTTHADNPSSTTDKTTRCNGNFDSKPRTTYDDDSDSTHNTENDVTKRHESNDNRTICLRVREVLYRRRGIIFATGAAFFFSAENMCMELLANSLNIFEIGAVMAVIVMALAFIGIIVTKKKFPNTKMQYFSLLVSGTFLAIGLPLALQSLKYMEVGDSITIIYTMPIFSGIFSWIILRERLRIIDFLFAFISLCGVVLIARPPFIFGNDDDVQEGENPLLGAIYALASAVSFALLVVAARKQSLLGIHPVVILFFNVIVVFITNVIICSALGEWTFPTNMDWGYIVGLGSSDFFAQTLIYMAVVVEVAMFVSIIATSEVILTFLWQYIFLSIVPDWLSAVGAVLIIASCVGMATKKELTPEDEADAVITISTGVIDPDIE